MSISDEIVRLSNIRALMRNRMVTKGISGAGTHTFSQLADDINAIVSLPSGISKMTAGATTSPINVSGSTLPHSLGVVPDLILAYTTSSALWSSAANYPAILATVRYVDASSSLGSGYKTLSIWRNSDGTIGGGVNPAYGITADPTSTQFTINAAQNVPIVKDIEYKWIAIKFG